MREHLSRSDFKLEELRTHKTTIYVVLDFKKMEPKQQGRFMRMLINLAFEKCYNIPLPQDRKERRTLFILDEVAQLGPMPSIAKGYQTLRGYDAKIWTFFQNYGALKRNYPSPNDLMGSATEQFFGAKDPETRAEIEKYLGEYLHKRQSGIGDGSGTYESKKPLLDKDEIKRTLKQKSPLQIVITGEGDSFELKRKTFIPSPDWKRYWEFKDSRFYPLAMRLRDSVLLKVAVALVLLWVGVVLWQSDVPPGEPWYFQWIAKGFWTWALMGLWVALFYGLSDQIELREMPPGPGGMTEEMKKKTREAMDEVQRRNAEFHERGRRSDELRAEPELWAAWEGLSREEREEWHRKTRPEFDAFVNELQRQLAEAREQQEREEQERKAARARKAEQDAARRRYELPVEFTFMQLYARYAERLVKAAANERDQVNEDYEILLLVVTEPELEEGVKRRAEGRKQKRSELRYTPKQDEARKRFYLPVGFTKDQLKERYAMLIDAAGAADQTDQITEDYDTLLPVAI